MKIAIDVMGGDNSPSADLDAVFGYIEDPSNKSVDFFLVGNESMILQYLTDNNKSSKYIKIINAEDVISDGDRPSRVLKIKPNCPIVKAVQLLKDGIVDAVVSSGNTGALLSTSLLLVGKIESIKRPALAPYIPSLKKGFLLCDAGANVDTKPEHLLQFAIMSQCYLKNIENIKEPKIGLLNIGKESNKGNELVKQAHILLKNKFKNNFVGNIESRYIFNEDIDIVICDGFTGNITLKLIEGIFSDIGSWIKKNSTSSLSDSLLTNGMISNLDYEEHGGTPLLGIKGIVIKSHGASTKKSIINSLKTAVKLYEKKLTNSIETGILNKVNHETI